MRKKRFFCFLLLLAGHFALYSQSQQHLTYPTVDEMRKGFLSPPTEYAHTMDFGLGRNLVQDSIVKQLDEIKRQGINAVSIEGVYGSPEPYLSQGYMERVKMLVGELKKRDMHLWIIDEGQYPSGFAGGLISKNAPELRMQGIVVSRRIQVKEGEKITKEKLADNILSAVAYNASTGDSRQLDVSNGTLDWNGLQGTWEIILVEHRFKTSVTRSATNPTHGKDTMNSLIDYLDPAATAKWMEFTHEQYKKYIGDEFGKTVLGFRGDEPEYNFTPWSPKLLQTFKEKKGYDVQPYLASFFLPKLTDEQKLIKADFWDVWSDMFRDNFFKVIADWCAKNGLEYTMHVNHEDKLMDLARSEGDFFKTMRYVQIPGVDAIWHQIWYDNVADFPKLASSAAHMYGRPRALSESFAAYIPKPTVADVHWVVNEEMVRGINFFEFMHWGSEYIKDTAFIRVSAYANRAAWLLSNGHPAAQIAVYCPTETMWLGNKDADSSLRKISRLLLEHQLDFDYIDRQGIASVFKLENGAFINGSGQRYTTILVPSVDILTADVVNKLKALAAKGGKVIFMGTLPKMLAGKTFNHSTTMNEKGWYETAGFENLSDVFYSALPHDVLLDKTLPGLKYQHRKWKNADMYFFFNEGKDDAECTMTVEGTGKTFFWSAANGDMHTAENVTTNNGRSTLPFWVKGYGTKILIIEH